MGEGLQVQGGQPCGTPVMEHRKVRRAEDGSDEPAHEDLGSRVIAEHLAAREDWKQQHCKPDDATYSSFPRPVTAVEHELEPEPNEHAKGQLRVRAGHALRVQA
jgi:hypothetical protein